MQIRNRVLNTTEEIVLKELSTIAGASRRIFPKMRLSDVIDKRDTYLEPDYFSFYTSSHFDFLIASSEAKPVMAIEYDGPSHNSPKQITRDRKKNSLCKEAGLPILRINANHILRKYRGMTLLRWIIETIELEEAFNLAQEKGNIAYDEIFDPAAIISDGTRSWPYWLSATATIRIREFLRKNYVGTRGGTAWDTLIGEDEDTNLHSLEYIRFGDRVLYVRTSVRDQDANLDKHTMIREVTHCEMGEQLKNFLQGDLPTISIKDFEPIYDAVCQRYTMKKCASWSQGFSS
jgi:hypothetical protein